MCIGTKYVSHDRWDYKEFVAVNVLKLVFLDLISFVCYTCNVSIDTVPLNYALYLIFLYAEQLNQSVHKVSNTNEAGANQFVGFGGGLFSVPS
jgi:hypothetical protein